MIDIVFVILQYGGYADTKCCLDSIIKKIDTDSFAVVIVDNASLDSSYQDVKYYIESLSDDRYYILKNNNNLGFANGNNMGITFAREKLGAKFVVAINNDIELISENIYQIVEKKYLEKKFAALGPLVLSGDGRYTTNPMAKKLFSDEEIDHEIKHTKRVLKLNEMHLIKLYNVYKKIKEKRMLSSDINSFRIDQMDIKLHGCFIVMSPEFFEKLKGFNPRTFLYMEEDILFLELRRKGLHTLYTPEICVFHKEGGAMSNVREYEKVKFVFTHRLRSQRIYKELLRQKGN